MANRDVDGARRRNKERVIPTVMPRAKEQLVVAMHQASATQVLSATQALPATQVVAPQAWRFVERLPVKAKH